MTRKRRDRDDRISRITNPKPKKKKPATAPLPDVTKSDDFGVRRSTKRFKRNTPLTSLRLSIKHLGRLEAAQQTTHTVGLRRAFCFAAPGLTVTALRVAVALLCHPYPTWWSRHSYAAIRFRTRFGRASCKKGLSELDRLGMIQRKRIFRGPYIIRWRHPSSWMWNDLAKHGAIVPPKHRKKVRWRELHKHDPDLVPMVMKRHFRFPPTERDVRIHYAIKKDLEVYGNGTCTRGRYDPNKGVSRVLSDYEDYNPLA